MRCVELRSEPRTTAIDRKWKRPPKRAGVWPTVQLAREGRSLATEAETSCSLPTVLEDHWPPVALLMPRRFNSAAIWRADGKCASSVKIGFMRSASSSACLLLASLPAVQPPSVWPRALAALRPSLVREEISERSF